MFGKKAAIPQDPIAVANADRLKRIKERIAEILERDDISALAFVCFTSDDSMVNGAILCAPQAMPELLFETSQMIVKFK